MKYTSRVRLRLANAGELAACLSQQMEKQYGKPQLIGHDTWSLTSQSGQCFLAVRGSDLLIEVLAPDIVDLEEMKFEISIQLGRMSEYRVGEILWDGDGQAIPSLPNLRLLTVKRLAQVTPSMRRIVFHAENLARFADDENYHLRLLLPGLDGGELILPVLTADGTVFWGPEGERAIMRKYTIRDVSPEKNEIVIDFVLHQDGGPGSRFAGKAKINDQIGAIGPGGGSGVKSKGYASWNLFAGDETALPAIARLIENLPAHANGRAFIEVTNANEEQDIAAHEGVDIVWLHRNGLRPEKSTQLIEAIAQEEFFDDQSVHVWGAGEFSVFKSLRYHLRHEKSHSKDSHLVTSYWRYGHAGGSV